MSASTPTARTDLSIGSEKSVDQALYFVSRTVDFAIIGGGSLVLYSIIAPFQHERSVIIWRSAAALAVVVNWPHFFATNFRLYSSPQAMKEYRFSSYVLPFVLLLVLATALVSPMFFAPLLAKIYLFWSPYHYSGQSVGITKIYAKRAGTVLSKIERLGLIIYVYGSFLVPTLYAETSTVGSQFYGVKYLGLGIPIIIPNIVAFVSLTLGQVFFVSLLWRRFVKKERVPYILLVPALAQYVWFIPGAAAPAFREFVPLFHSLQYLIIVWAMQLKEKLDTSKLRPSREFLISETARWSAINIAGGIVLFWALPHFVSLFSTQEYSFTLGVTLAVVQIHHFIVDGIVWKLRRSSVSSPLMVSLDDLRGTT